MASQSRINVQPKILNLALYAGDGFDFRLICKNSADPPEPVDMTGEVNAHIRLAHITEDPPIIEFTVEMVDAYLGIVVLSLTGTQTQDLIDHASGADGKFEGVWDIQWTPSEGEPRTLIQGEVECVADVTR